MNQRERVLAALDLKEPDRVPTHAILIDANNVDKILGKPEMDDFQTMEQVKRQSEGDWIEEFNQLVESVQTTVFSRCAEAAAKTGLDCMQVGVLPFKVTHELDDAGVPMISDVFGRVWRILNNAGNINPYYIRGTTNTVEKWNVQKERLEGPAAEKYAKFARRFFKSINSRNKNSIFVIATNDLAGVFESTWQGMGIEFFSRQLHKDKEFIKKAFDAVADFVIAVDKGFMDAGCEVFVESGDLAYKHRPIMSPKDYRDLLLPAYQKVTSAIHERGKKAVLHTDGYITPLLDFIIDAGFDGLHSLEPTAGVDLAEVKAKAGDKICLMGGIDIAHVLVDGTRQEVEGAVKAAIKAAGQGGGYIVSPANMHPGVSVERLRWMVDATKKFGTYPLGT
nr:uroporphyrinogen decarboxylase family protein [Candidatus Sigynarchaeum springense]